MAPLESLFRELNDRGGRYIVVGELAVVLHGHLRVGRVPGAGGPSGADALSGDAAATAAVASGGRELGSREGEGAAPAWTGAGGGRCSRRERQ